MTSAAPKKAKKTSDCTTTDAVKTSQGHHRSEPMAMIHASTMLVIRNGMARFGFHNGRSKIDGIAHARSSTARARRPQPTTWSDLHSASTPNDNTRPISNAPPHRAPWRGSMRTGMASSQYWSGPGS